MKKLSDFPSPMKLNFCFLLSVKGCAVEEISRTVHTKICKMQKNGLSLKCGFHYSDFFLTALVTDEWKYFVERFHMSQNDK